MPERSVGRAPARREAILRCLATGLALTGTALATGADQGAPFVLEAAPPRMARLYILRSGAADPARREAPVIHVNGKKVFALAIESYSSIALEPGTYSLALKPGEFEARSWESTVGISIQANALYFLSVFKEHEPAATARPPSPGPTAANLIARPGQSVRVAGVSFEFLDQIEAVKLLPALNFVRPGDPLPYRGP